MVVHRPSSLCLELVVPTILCENCENRQRILLLSHDHWGSCFLQDLLNCHPEIEIAGQLLNNQHRLMDQPVMDTIRKQLTSTHNTYVGFQLFPDQLYIHKVNFGEFISALEISHVVVLWREKALEAYVSSRMTLSNTVTISENREMEIEPQKFLEYLDQLSEEWEKIGKDWPGDVQPIFVKYEDLVANPTKQIKRILEKLSLPYDPEVLVVQSKRQSTVLLPETNYADLPQDIQEMTVDVEKILRNKINVSLQTPENLSPLAPDREPSMPPGGWKYPVTEPYLPAIAKQYAYDAINSGSISSTGYWPRELGRRLCAYFKMPVAQPCSNGFTALFTALQARNVGEGDEVMVPAMTTVAVPNAVYFRRAKPVFVDNTSHGYNPGWREYDAMATTNTKAIVVTHTYGVAADDIDFIARECRSRGWVLIEDISDCVGVTCTNSEGEEQLLGTFGDFAVASLHANKIVHGGDGGFIMAKDVKIGQRLASIVDHGFTPSFPFVHFEPAPNAKIHGVGAAVACGVLETLPHILKHRSQMSQWYRENLDGVPLTKMPECGPLDTPAVFGVECASKEERSQLRAFLAQHGIETRDYFFALHLQPAYLSVEDNVTVLPNAENLGSTGFYLPSHTNLKLEDVLHICSIVETYFTYGRNNDTANESLVNSYSSQKTPCAVQITPDGFFLQVRQYRSTGALMTTVSRDHVNLDAVKLAIHAEEVLLNERYDQVNLLLDSITDLLSRTSDDDPLSASIHDYFNRFTAYFDSHPVIEQPLNKPWLLVNLNGEQFPVSRDIPTTLDLETLQLLAWLTQQRRPNDVWKIGPCMGRAAALMAEVCSTTKVFACDSYKWRAGMREFLRGAKRDGKSFLEVFLGNLKTFKDQVQTVTWYNNMPSLPVALEKSNPGLVFLDIAHEALELEKTWTIIKENLMPNETIVVFNGLSYKSLPFFIAHANELKGVAKPHSPAKAFLYVDQNKVLNNSRVTVSLEKRLKFYTSPAADHRHSNTFCQTVDLLRQEFHSDEADVLFVPAVENAMSNNLELLYRHPWVGIIHSGEFHPESFYEPDLQRLCSIPRFLAALQNCQGLVTLTCFQTQYLITHLPDNIPKFPVQQLYYPVEAKGDIEASTVPQQMTENDEKVTLLSIGNLPRDFDLFFKVPIPPNFQKELVLGDEISRETVLSAPPDVIISERLSTGEYEAKLKKSVVFLTLKHEGAVNTVILQCIAWNVPIVAANMLTSTDYLGQGYPLLYDPDKPANLHELLTLEGIENAISYLEQMDKSKFTPERFQSDFKNGAVMLAVSPIKRHLSWDPSLPGNDVTPSPKQFDVTICICSFNRTHHLPSILKSLWEQQNYRGTYEILIWNNNPNRDGLVQKYAKKYLQQSHDKKATTLIFSTENYRGSVQFAMASLMRGKSLLIFNDDIVPGGNFLSFFISAHKKHPEDVLCVRGQEFLPHHLDLQNPQKIWREDGVLLRNDSDHQQLLHFAEDDVYLIPKQGVREMASVEMPDPSFALVGSYWMSFVLSHKFHRNLRKLSTAGQPISPVFRAPDLETGGMPQHTKTEIHDARLRLYLHHMLQGWPKWEEPTVSHILSAEEKENLRKKKQKFWDDCPQIGYNISSLLDDPGIEALSSLGTKCVRLGAVGVGHSLFYEFSGILKEPQKELERLSKLITKLGKVGISVVITLDRRLASSPTWALLAKTFVTVENVVGYDLINEPYTDTEIGLLWASTVADADMGDKLKQTNKSSRFSGKLDDNHLCAPLEMQKLMDTYKEMILAIREVDPATPIILEPSFWGQIGALSKFPVEVLTPYLDDNILISVHFYEPVKITSRRINQGQYVFPGPVPLFSSANCTEEIVWNTTKIIERLQKAKVWADSKGVRIFLGEFGISRNVGGAPDYLKAVIKACQEVRLMGLMFSFRDPDWEAMDYELGDNVNNYDRIYDNNANPFIDVIQMGTEINTNNFEQPL